MKRWLAVAVTAILLAALAFLVTSGEISPRRRAEYMESMQDDEYAFLFE